MAVHRFRLAAAGSPEIAVDASLLRGPRVFVDGVPAERGRERGRPWWRIPLAGGGERRLVLAGTLTGLRAMTGDEEIELERRLAWWELLLAFLPIALVTVGGLLGGLIGGGGVIAGLAIVRGPWPAIARAGAALAVLAGCLLAWLAVREAILLFYR